MYLVASLLEMSKWGGTDADSLKKGIDNIFNNGLFKTDDYQTKLVSATSDGASVNFRKKDVGYTISCLITDHGY